MRVWLLPTPSGLHAHWPQPALAEDVARLCGYLPLAVRITGAKLASPPTCAVQAAASSGTRVSRWSTIFISTAMRSSGGVLDQGAESHVVLTE